MTSEQICEWFTPERLKKLDLQKIEDLAGIDRGVIINLLESGCILAEERHAIKPVINILEVGGFNDCNK